MPVIKLETVDPLKKQLYFDYFSALVKTLSLLAYTFRWMPQLAKAIHQHVPSIILQLLKTCPHDLVGIRKELLVATRHILSTDFRVSFAPYVKDLLDESLLIGRGISAGSSLRHISISMLADLIHHVRMSLSMDLLVKILEKYSSCLLDYTLPLSIQTMSAKLLLNLVESIPTDAEHSTEKQRLLWRLFNTMALKLKSMVLPMQEFMDSQYRLVNEGKSPSAVKSKDGSKDFIQFYVVDSCLHASVDISHDTVKDVKFLLRTLITGMKITLLNLKACQQTGGTHAAHLNIPLNSVEAEKFSSIFKNCIVVFQLFQLNYDQKVLSTVSQNGSGLLTSSSVPGSKFPPVAQVLHEDKDLMDQFSFLFNILPPALFNDILSAGLDDLLAAMIRNPLLICIPQYFLAIHDVSKMFASLLLKKLVLDLPDLGSKNLEKAQIYLRLFKLVFLSISVFPEDNECVLQTHLATLIKDSLKYALEAEEPLHYFYLLRSLFRSIGGGRFELLYKEVLPLLPLLLDALNPMLTSSIDTSSKELFIELSLTIPVRLSVLLPYLSSLMKPLVMSLQSSPELISQGLRTLELCIDNLTHEFLEPVLAPVMPALLEALWKHCKPLPYPTNHSHATLRILGKLSGRSRKFYRDPLCLSTRHTNHVDDSSICSMEIQTVSDDLLGDLKKNTLTVSFKRIEYDILCLNIWKSPILTTDHGPSSYEYAYEALMANEENADRSCLLKVVAFASVSSFSFAAQALELLVDRISKAAASPTDWPWELTFFEDLIFNSDFSNLKFDSVIIRVLVSLSNLTCDLKKIKLLRLIMDATNSLFSSIPITIHRALLVLQNLLFDSDSLPLLPVQFFTENALKLLRSLFASLKDVSPSLFTSSISQARELIRQIIIIIKKSLPGNDITPSVHGVLVFLFGEIGSPSPLARSSARASFDILLPSYTTTDFVRLLSLLNDRTVVTAFLNKPMKLLSISFQIGIIEAIYFLWVKSGAPSFLSEDEDLWTKIIEEIVSLADDDERSSVASSNAQTSPSSNGTVINQAQPSSGPPFISPVAPNSQSTTLPSQFSNFGLKQMTLILDLKMSCIKLLSVAISSQDFFLTKNLTLRNRIIQLLFKGLYARNRELIEICKSGLAQVISIPLKLPKDLLQSGLRPVLMNLSDPKRLSVASIEGLGRLLELLTTYFKVEIGRKLLDHVKFWCESSDFTNIASDNNVANGEHPMILAIFKIFHLLPANSSIFMDELLELLVKIEDLTGTLCSSPYRIAVFNYVSKYPELALSWILKKADARVGDNIAADSELCRKDTLDADRILLLLQTWIQMDSQNLFKSHIIKLLVESKFKRLTVSFLSLLQLELKSASFADELSVEDQTRMVEEMLAILKSFNAQLYNDPALIKIAMLLQEVYSIIAIPSLQARIIIALSHKCFESEVKSISYSVSRFVSACIPSADPQVILLLWGHFCTLLSEWSQEAENNVEICHMIHSIVVYTLNSNVEFSLVQTNFVDALVNTLVKIPLSNSSNAFYELLNLIPIIIYKDSKLLSSSKTALVPYLGKLFETSKDLFIRQAVQNIWILLLHYEIYTFPTKQEFSEFAQRLFKFSFGTHMFESRFLIRKTIEFLLESFSSGKLQSEAPDLKPPWFIDSILMLLQEDQHLNHPLFHSNFVFLLGRFVKYFEVIKPYMKFLVPAFCGSMLRIIISLHQAGSAGQPAASTAILSGLQAQASALSIQGKSPTASQEELEDPKHAVFALLELIVGGITDFGSFNEHGSGKRHKKDNLTPVVQASIVDFTLENVLLLLVRAYIYDSSSCLPIINLLKEKFNELPFNLFPWAFLQKFIDELLGVTDESSESILSTSQAIDDHLPSFSLILKLFTQLSSAMTFSTICEHTTNLPRLMFHLGNHPSFLENFTTLLSNYLRCSVTSVTAWKSISIKEFSLEFLLDALALPSKRAFILFVLSCLDHSVKSDFTAETAPILLKALSGLLVDYQNQLRNVVLSTGTGKSFASLIEKSLHIVGNLCLTMPEFLESKTQMQQLLGNILETGDPLLSNCAEACLSSWILDERGLFTTKEKITMLICLVKKCRQSKELAKNSVENSRILQIYDVIARVYQLEKKKTGSSSSEIMSFLEADFLRGWWEIQNASSKELRYENRFTEVMDENLPRDAFSRILYAFGVQNWDPLKSVFFLGLVNSLLMCLNLTPEKTFSPGVRAWMKFVRTYADASYAVFKTFYSAIWRKIIEISKDVLKTTQLCKEWSESQALFLIQATSFDLENMSVPKCIYESILQFSDLAAVEPSTGPCILPMIPMNVSFGLAKKLKLWHETLLYMERSSHVKYDETFGNYNSWFSSRLYSVNTLEATLASDRDPLAALYMLLGENDWYYGRHRMISIFNETNVALGLEQIGEWEPAQIMYEIVQAKARAGLLPYPICQSEGTTSIAGGSLDDDDGDAKRSNLVNPSREFQLWESRWLECAQKLQQWDIIVELAKLDNNIDLSLEGSLRLLDWTSIKDQVALKGALDLLTDLPTPRRKVFEGFLCLNQGGGATNTPNAVATAGNKPLSRILEEGFQCCLQEFSALPETPINAHLPLLHYLQEFVELSEAQPVYSMLFQSQGGALASQGNRPTPVFIQEVKAMLQTWRERVPNIWEDLDWWSQITSWRQHVFSVMNLIFGASAAASSVGSRDPTGSNPNDAMLDPMIASMSFRGYHETAWIINRFAHVSRKHSLPDVCIQMLNKIYTLPNIEIQDAFLKLREQAKCYLSYHSTSLITESLNVVALNELASGLEIINATNLNYFNTVQKADFFTLKARFLSKLGLLDEANKGFAQAVQLDLGHAKAWLSWGDYNYARCKKALCSPMALASSSSDTTVSNDHLVSTSNIAAAQSWATHAIHCYLQSAALSKSFRSRNHLLRTLFLLGLEDENTPDALVDNVPTVNPQGSASTAASIGLSAVQSSATTPTSAASQGQSTIGKSFELYYNDIPAASWIPTIPHLFKALGRKKEGNHALVILLKLATAFPQAIFYELYCILNNESLLSNASSCGLSLKANLEEINSMLKSNHPLLTLTMETLADQIITRLVTTPDEDFYHLIVVLLKEAHQVNLDLLNLNNPDESAKAFSNLRDSIKKIADMLKVESHASHKFSALFNDDFMDQSVDIRTIVDRLVCWKKKLHDFTLNVIPSVLHMENFSRYLAEFSTSKLSDDIQIPGLYPLLFSGNVPYSSKNNPSSMPSSFWVKDVKDSLASGVSTQSSGLVNNEIKKIARVDTNIKVYRRSVEDGTSFRKITFVATDGSRWAFRIENPTKRRAAADKEELFLHCLRGMNILLGRKKESRSKGAGLVLTAPAIVPLSKSIRLVQENPFSEPISLEGILHQDHRINVDTFFMDTLPSIWSKNSNGSPVSAYQAVLTSSMPDDVLSTYVSKLTASSMDYWIWRKQFIQQYSMICLLDYVFNLASRGPGKLLIDIPTGFLTPVDILEPVESTLLSHLLDPQVSSSAFGEDTRVENGAGKTSCDAFPRKCQLPFRMTPNIQKFISPQGIESVFLPSVLAISRVLLGEFSTSCSFELENSLLLFLRSEMEDVEGGQELSFKVRDASVSSSMHFSLFKGLDVVYQRLLLLAGVKEREKLAPNQLIMIASMPPCSTLLASPGTPPTVPMASPLTCDQNASNSEASTLFISVYQSLNDLLNAAVNPVFLAQMSPFWHPWF